MELVYGAIFVLSTFDDFTNIFVGFVPGNQNSTFTVIEHVTCILYSVYFISVLNRSDLTLSSLALAISIRNDVRRPPTIFYFHW